MYFGRTHNQCVLKSLTVAISSLCPKLFTLVTTEVAVLTLGQNRPVYYNVYRGVQAIVGTAVTTGANTTPGLYIYRFML